MPTAYKPSTAAIYVRSFKTNRWPSFRVSEKTAAGGYRNTREFGRYAEAMAFARAQARAQGVRVVEAAHECA